MNEFSAEDYLRILAERMRSKLMQGLKKEEEEREEFVYDSEKVVVSLGESQHEIVDYPK